MSGLLLVCVPLFLQKLHLMCIVCCLVNTFPVLPPPLSLSKTAPPALLLQSLQFLCLLHCFLGVWAFSCCGLSAASVAAMQFIHLL